MIIDGEKYACEACVRGHRVSNCQHTDRPLQHINKKGRPVSQCQHCRSMRKSRSAHIKCDCGEKTSKCAHLKQTVDGHRETCCCNHGGRCTCAHKKEQPQLDTVPEFDSDAEEPAVEKPKPKPGSRRRRANTIHSDGGLSLDDNGRHKPAHKNRSSQGAGPYQLNRVNSLQSTSSGGSGGSGSGESSRSRQAADGRSSGSREQRRVRSEAASPLIGSPNFQHQNSQLPPLDLSGIEYPPYNPNGTFDLFGTRGSQDHDRPIFSAGLSSGSVDWSHYDLSSVKGGEFEPSSYSQTGTQSFNGYFDFTSENAPTLAGTTSTSGDVSEVDDNFIPGDIDFDAFGTANNDFLRHRRMMGSSVDFASMDCNNFLKSSNTRFLTPASSLDDGGPIAGGAFSLVEDDPAFWAHKYNNLESHDGLPDVSGGFGWDGQ